MSSKPTFNLVRVDNTVNSHNVFNNTTFNDSTMRGGNDLNIRPQSGVKANDDELYLYKAKKYHYKCQQKLRELMAQGKPCPAGYEKYLEPFRA